MAKKQETEDTASSKKVRKPTPKKEFSLDSFKKKIGGEDVPDKPLKWIPLSPGFKEATGLPGFAKGYVYSIFASVFGAAMAAFLVDWLLPFAYNIGLDGVRASILPWIFFGGLISIEQIYFANNKVLPAK